MVSPFGTVSFHVAFPSFAIYEQFGAIIEFEIFWWSLIFSKREEENH